MKDKVRKALTWMAVVLITGAIIFAFFVGKNSSPVRISPYFICDNFTLVPDDTIIKWYQKIKYVPADPETVYVPSDTIDVDTIWGGWPEAIVSLDKSGNQLAFSTIIPADSFNKATSRMYAYTNIGEEFSIRARGDGFHVKSTRRFWDRFNLGISGSVGLRVWGDSTISFADPRVYAFGGWGPVKVGPEIALDALRIRLEVSKEF